MPYSHKIVAVKGQREHRYEHIHSLSPTYGQTIHWPSHKHIDVYIRGLVKQLWQNNDNLARMGML